MRLKRRFQMFTKVKIISILVILVSVLGSLWYVYHDLTGQIETQKEAKKAAQKKVDELNTKLGSKDNDIARLKISIEDSNKALIETGEQLANNVMAFEKWKKAHPADKYKIKVVEKIITKKIPTETCSDGIELNKMISELNYEDL
jgi:peptidoglycan hydrolase CwlO-like protein